MKYIDNFLNKITMYKLVLWGLMIQVFIAILLSFVFPNSFPESGVSMIESVLLLLVVCHITNTGLSRLFKVQLNAESAYITALILFFVLAPISTFDDVKTLVAISVIAMASKYLFAIGKKHIFNPVAIALLIAGFFGSGAASWWVGSSAMLIPVAMLGFLVLRKLRRFKMFFSFAIMAIFSTVVMAFSTGLDIMEILVLSLLSGPFVFFGTIMFTEPLTAPPSTRLQVLYGVLVGALFGTQFDFGLIYSTPQFALIVGNILSYIVSPRARLVLTLVQKNTEPGSVIDFVWKSDEKFDYKPGQYLEWTLGHSKPDTRGNRRYFTIASSPTEENLHLGVKFYPDPSSFKARLASLNIGDQIIASQLSGEFTMPSDINKKLVFIAGGIGVTPFRSMAKYLVDKNQRRNIVMLYSNRTPSDIAYKEIFDAAEIIGVQTIHVVNDLAGTTLTPNMRVGMINAELIMKDIPDYKERMYYISGPHGMVTAFEDTLGKLGVPSKNIKTDFFPGFV